MNITSAQYCKSFVSVASIDLPILPTIAFIGRSNVGKSSLINHLTHRKKLVKTSATPGKTQMINFFLINNAFYIVDLPGYGFAKVPDKIKAELTQMINDFITYHQPLQLLFQLVDIRHQPSSEDVNFFRYYSKLNREHQIIANKTDKLGKGEIPKMLKTIKDRMATTQEILRHSIKDPQAKKRILSKIAQTVYQ